MCLVRSFQAIQRIKCLDWCENVVWERGVKKLKKIQKPQKHSTPNALSKKAFISNSSFFVFIAENRCAHEMFRMQNHCARWLHIGTDGTPAAGLQAHIPWCWRATVSGANKDTPPLDTSKDGEGKVQAVWKGKLHSWHAFLTIFTVQKIARLHSVNPHSTLIQFSYSIVHEAAEE